MKILFVDIDGVLNHEIWYQSQECLNLSKQNIDDNRRYFAPFSVEMLNYIIEKTGAKIVVSSSWRHGRTVDQLKQLFSSNGIVGDVIDKTIDLKFMSKIDYNYSVPRGCEIKAWLEMNKGILGDKMHKAKYVILDDDSDMLFWQRNNFIHIDSYCGITPNNAEKAIKILNK